MKLITTFALLVSLAAPLSATTANIVVRDGPSLRVNYRDLDLGSTAGRATLERRIHSAADQLCIEHNVAPLDVRMQQLECYRVAVRSGNDQMANFPAG